MRAPISVCIIARDEGPRLERCLLSLRDHVEHIVVLDTGSVDDTVQVAKRHADVVETFVDCNNPETGLIEDFSMARNKSFSFAKHDWVMWVDADDVVEHAERLNSIVLEYADSEKPVLIMFPYEYAHDANGNSVVNQYRERLIRGREHFNWVSPVHECLIPLDVGATLNVKREDVTWKHNRAGKGGESNRNLRILESFIQKVGESDARQLYYIGLEYGNAGKHEQMIKFLSRYLELSGWDDEKYMACLRLAQHYLATGETQKLIDISFKAVSFQENWGEAYFFLAKAYYSLAASGVDKERNYGRVVSYAKRGLDCPPTQTVLFVNPNERDYEIHKYLNVAFNSLGDVRNALESCNIALQKIPDDANFLFNKRRYESHLAHQQLKVAKAVLLSLGEGVPEAPVGDGPFPVAGIASSFHIPETWDTHGYPTVMSDAQLQAVVMLIWKEYMNQDELLSATTFLEHAPYRVRHSAATLEALAKTKATYAWIKDLDLVQKGNSPLDADGNLIEVELGVCLPEPFGDNQQGDRYRFVASRLAPESSIVDFGCFDGQFTNRYGLEGHCVVGLDLTETSVALANRKAEEFKTGAKHIVCHFEDALDHVEPNSFDYATSTDTYEHLLDPVEEMLKPAFAMLKNNGKFLMTTPHGQWFRGQYVSWAHPWITPDWLGPSPRGHLIAPGSWDVVANFEAAGFTVKDCFPQESTKPDVVGQGNVIVEAHKNVRETKLNVVFYIGPGIEPWTPESIKRTGMGGSETAACEMAKQLAALGHEVRVYGDCRESEGIYDYVSYLHHDKFRNLECDVLLVSRQAQALADELNVSAKIKLLWVHDVFALNGSNELLLKADRILALSQWHKESLLNHHNLHSDHVVVTRNGINLERFEGPVKRNPFKVVNSSSPDRSLPVLLECWSEIKKLVPQAELHLFYGFGNWSYGAQFNPGQVTLIEQLKAKIEELAPLGVVNHGRVNQNELAEHMLSSGVWAFPTWFTETSCIGAMEAQAAGLRIVTSDLAALKETVGSRGVLLEGVWTSAEYKAAFIKETVKALKKNGSADRVALAQHARDNFSWSGLALDWDKMFKDLIQDCPMPGYRASRSYQ